MCCLNQCCAQLTRKSFLHGLGHEERFLRPGLSAGFGFRKETIAGMCPTGELRRNRRFAEPHPHLGEKYGMTVAQVVEVYGVAADGISRILRHA